MSGFGGTTGIRLTGQLVTDRETGKSYVLHSEGCADTFETAMRAAGVDTLARFAPMGPAVLEEGEACNLGTCPNA